MKRDIIIAAIIGGLILIIMPTKEDNKRIEDNKIKEVIAQTWGWAKVISKPVVVVSSEKPVTCLMQVDVQISEVETFSALINTQMFATPGSWKKGDEVLIANFSGKPLPRHGFPSTTYLVVGYRSQSDKPAAK